MCLGFAIASCDEPTSVFTDSGEIFAGGKRVEDVVVQKAMAKEIGEGAEVVQTMETEDDVCIWVVSGEFPAERRGVDGVLCWRWSHVSVVDVVGVVIAFANQGEFGGAGARLGRLGELH